MKIHCMQMGVQKEYQLDDNVENNKARLIAKGYSQVEGIDFGEIVSPIYKLTYIRLLLFVEMTFDLDGHERNNITW
jgi:hypothetical protein